MNPETPYDFWNHNIHPITGYFLIENDRKVELFSNNKYLIKPFAIPKEITLNPYNILYDNTLTA